MEQLDIEKSTYVGKKLYRVSGDRVNDNNGLLCDIKFVVTEFVCCDVRVLDSSKIPHIRFGKNPVILELKRSIIDVVFEERITVDKIEIDLFPSMPWMWVSSCEANVLEKAIERIRHCMLESSRAMVLVAEAELTKTKKALSDMEALVERSRTYQPIINVDSGVKLQIA